MGKRIVQMGEIVESVLSNLQGESQALFLLSSFDFCWVVLSS